MENPISVADNVLESGAGRIGVMTKLTMTSWARGVQTVSLIEAVKQYSTGSLIGAKAAVDRLLPGEAVTIE